MTTADPHETAEDLIVDQVVLIHDRSMFSRPQAEHVVASRHVVGFDVEITVSIVAPAGTYRVGDTIHVDTSHLPKETTT